MSYFEKVGCRTARAERVHSLRAHLRLHPLTYFPHILLAGLSDAFSDTQRSIWLAPCLCETLT